AARLVLTATIVATAAVRTDALPGALDPSFGFGGKVLPSFNAEGVAVALDHLDRIVMVGTRKVNGHSQIVVARFNTTGVSLDLGFGTGGVAIGSFGSNADNVAAAVAIDAANRVI